MSKLKIICKKNSVKKILVTLNKFGEYSKEAKQKLKKISKKIIYLNENKILNKNLIYHIKDADYYLAGIEKIDKKLLSCAKNLKIIARGGIGYNNIDLNYSKKKNISITNTPKIASNSVCNLVLAFVFLRLRNIINYTSDIKNKKWKPIINDEPSMLNIGIIGVGNIGSKLIKKIKFLNFKNIFVNDIKKKNITGVQWKSKNYLYKNCDIISINTPLTNKTNNLFNAKTFKKLKKNCTIINTARGEIINEDDLYNFLKKNQKAQVFLDTFIKEPYLGKLTKLKNAYFTPHIGSMTKQSRCEMDTIAANEIYRFNYKKKLKHKVN